MDEISTKPMKTSAESSPSISTSRAPYQSRITVPIAASISVSGAAIARSRSLRTKVRK